MVDSRELRTLRDRQAASLTALDRLAYAPPGSAPMLVQVFQQTTIPAATGKYFACHPVDPGGPECEGCVPTFTAESGTVFVLVVGNRVPVAGDYLKAKPIGGRWVAESGKVRSCADDLTHVCICDCPNPFPRQFFYGDANGTHTLNWLGSGLGWRGSSTQPGADVYTGLCTHSITNLNYSISLAYSCVPGAGSPSSGVYPTGYWIFGIGFFSVFNCTSSYKYTNTQFGSAVLLGAEQRIEGFHCDFASGFSFTIPSTVNGLATPGGGGAALVVP